MLTHRIYVVFVCCIIFTWLIVLEHIYQTPRRLTLSCYSLTSTEGITEREMPQKVGGFLCLVIFACFIFVRNPALGCYSQWKPNQPLSYKSGPPRPVSPTRLGRGKDFPPPFCSHFECLTHQAANLVSCGNFKLSGLAMAEPHPNLLKNLD